MDGGLKKHVPTAATLGNLLAGFAAIGFAAEGQTYVAAAMIIVGVLFDAVDGGLARLCNACSDFGAELDSLADVVTFGVAPAVLVGRMAEWENPGVVWALLALFPVCAAVRLARFNVMRPEDVSRHGAFAGLPSTGAGGCVASVVLTLQGAFGSRAVAYAPLLLALVLVLGVLMVSRVPYGHAGSFVGRHPRMLLAFGVVLIGATMWMDLHELVFAGIFGSYALIGPAAAVGIKVRDSLGHVRMSG